MTEVFKSTCQVIAPNAYWWKWAVAAGAAIVAELHPVESVRTAVITAVALLLVDTVTGIYASIVTGKALSSQKFGRVIAKAFVYMVFPAVISFGLSAIGLAGMSAPGATAVATLAVCTEMISITENIERAGILKVPGWIKKLMTDRISDLQEKLDEKNN